MCVQAYGAVIITYLAVNFHSAMQSCIHSVTIHALTHSFIQVHDIIQNTLTTTTPEPEYDEEYYDYDDEYLDDIKVRERERDREKERERERDGTRVRRGVLRLR